jgi:hypothetical protein
MGKRNMFVGLDVHKETVDVSIADGNRHGEVRHHGVIASARHHRILMIMPHLSNVHKDALLEPFSNSWRDTNTAT